MFCPNCGKEILDPVTSCPHCNEKIVENVEVEVITNTTQKPVKKSKRRYLALVFGVISIFFGIPWYSFLDYYKSRSSARGTISSTCQCNYWYYRPKFITCNYYY